MNNGQHQQAPVPIVAPVAPVQQPTEQEMWYSGDDGSEQEYWSLTKCVEKGEIQHKGVENTLLFETDTYSPLLASTNIMTILEEVTTRMGTLDSCIRRTVFGYLRVVDFSLTDSQQKKMQVPTTKERSNTRESMAVKNVRGQIWSPNNKRSTQRPQPGSQTIPGPAYTEEKKTKGIEDNKLITVCAVSFLIDKKITTSVNDSGVWDFVLTDSLQSRRTLSTLGCVEAITEQIRPLMKEMKDIINNLLAYSKKSDQGLDSMTDDKKCFLLFILLGSYQQYKANKKEKLDMVILDIIGQLNVFFLDKIDFDSEKIKGMFANMNNILANMNNILYCCKYIIYTSGVETMKYSLIKGQRKANEKVVGSPAAQSKLVALFTRANIREQTAVSSSAFHFKAAYDEYDIGVTPSGENERQPTRRKIAIIKEVITAETWKQFGNILDKIKLIDEVNQGEFENLRDEYRKLIGNKGAAANEDIDEEKKTVLRSIKALIDFEDKIEKEKDEEYEKDKMLETFGKRRSFFIDARARTRTGGNVPLLCENLCNNELGIEPQKLMVSMCLTLLEKKKKKLSKKMVDKRYTEKSCKRSGVTHTKKGPKSVEKCEFCSPILELLQNCGEAGIESHYKAIEDTSTNYKLIDAFNRKVLGHTQRALDTVEDEDDEDDDSDDSDDSDDDEDIEEEAEEADEEDEDMKDEEDEDMKNEEDEDMKNNNSTRKRGSAELHNEDDEYKMINDSLNELATKIGKLVGKQQIKIRDILKFESLPDSVILKMIEIFKMDGGVGFDDLVCQIMAYNILEEIQEITKSDDDDGGIDMEFTEDIYRALESVITKLPEGNIPDNWRQTVGWLSSLLAPITRDGKLGRGVELEHLLAIAVQIIIAGGLPEATTEEGKKIVQDMLRVHIRSFPDADILPGLPLALMGLTGFTAKLGKFMFSEPNGGLGASSMNEFYKFFATRYHLTKNELLLSYMEPNQIKSDLNMVRMSALGTIIEGGDRVFRPDRTTVANFTYSLVSCITTANQDTLRKAAMTQLHRLVIEKGNVYDGNGKLKAIRILGDRTKVIEKWMFGLTGGTQVDSGCQLDNKDVTIFYKDDPEQAGENKIYMKILLKEIKTDDLKQKLLTIQGSGLMTPEEKHIESCMYTKLRHRAQDAKLLKTNNDGVARTVSLNRVRTKDTETWQDPDKNRVRETGTNDDMDLAFETGCICLDSISGRSKYVSRGDKMQAKLGDLKGMSITNDLEGILNKNMVDKPVLLTVVDCGFSLNKDDINELLKEYKVDGLMEKAPTGMGNDSMQDFHTLCNHKGKSKFILCELKCRTSVRDKLKAVAKADGAPSQYQLLKSGHEYFQQLVESVGGEEGEDEVDETGIKEDDIELVMFQIGVSRAEAVKALKSNDNDAIKALESLYVYVPTMARGGDDDEDDDDDDDMGTVDGGGVRKSIKGTRRHKKKKGNTRRKRKYFKKTKKRKRRRRKRTRRK